MAEHTCTRHVQPQKGRLVNLASPATILPLRVFLLLLLESRCCCCCYYFHFYGYYCYGYGCCCCCCCFWLEALPGCLLTRRLLRRAMLNGVSLSSLWGDKLDWSRFGEATFVVTLATCSTLVLLRLLQYIPPNSANSHVEESGASCSRSKGWSRWDLDQSNFIGAKSYSVQGVESSLSQRGDQPWFNKRPSLLK